MSEEALDKHEVERIARLALKELGAPTVDLTMAPSKAAPGSGGSTSRVRTGPAVSRSAAGTEPRRNGSANRSSISTTDYSDQLSAISISYQLSAIS